MKFNRIIFIVATGLTFASTSLAANPGMLDNDPKRPSGAISADLGIPAAQFIACFKDVNPTSKGTKASRAREHANKDMLLPCLQQANPNITNTKLDNVMDTYRPEGRIAGN